MKEQRLEFECDLIELLQKHGFIEKPPKSIINAISITQTQGDLPTVEINSTILPED